MNHKDYEELKKSFKTGNRLLFVMVILAIAIVTYFAYSLKK